ncbi:MAG: MOSC domain-containing protein, partial [Rhodobacteraceae bacterium]|nr:MOSC domain-containing protein [Paracoccaceae bacterium]
KHIVSGPVIADTLGLAGDAQGDTLRHGGRDKAVHAYPASHYALWRQDLPQIAARLRPGGFGENLVVAGVTEQDICLGDRWRIGGALMEVSQSRQPCWKLNFRFGVTDMARRVQTSGRTGWYFRVLERGSMEAPATATLVLRAQPEWPLTRVARLLYRDVLDLEALAALADLPRLPDSWLRLVRRRIETGSVEDWTPRLDATSP